MEVVQAVCRDEGTLTIFCGAGVSMDAGFQSWPRLIEELTDLVHPQLARAIVADTGSDLLRRAELIDRLRPEGVTLRAMLTQVLYGRPRFGEASPIADAVARLVSIMPERVRLITTNFDEQLESVLRTYFTRAGTVCAVGLDGAEGWSAAPPEADAVAVLHVHGLVVPDGDGLDPIILTETSFLERGHEVRAVISDCLRTSNVLFIGVSLTDPNLLASLAAARELESSEPQQPVESTHEHFVLTVEEDIKGLSREETWSYLEAKRSFFADTFGAQPVSLKAYSQVSQAIYDLGLAVAEPERYLSDEPTSSSRYGFRLGRLLERAYGAVGLSDEIDVIDGPKARDVSDRLHQALFEEGGPGRLLRDWGDALHSELLAEHGLNHEYLTDEGIALFLWLRARSRRPAQGESPPFALRLIGTSAYSHREPWSAERLVDLTHGSLYPAVQAAFYGTSRTVNEEPSDGRYRLWQSIIAVPLILQESPYSVLSNFGSVTLNSTLALCRLESLREAAKEFGQGVRDRAQPSVLSFLGDDQWRELVDSIQQSAKRVLELEDLELSDVLDEGD